MSLTLPFRTQSFTVYGIDDPRTRTVSLAVRVIDEFTQKAVVTPVRVTLTQKQSGRFLKEQRPFRNQSGDFCFEGQPNGSYSLLAEPDPVNDYYFLHPLPAQPWTDIFQRDITLPIAGGPGLEITLAPKPGYPFPPGTTVVRGRLTDFSGSGVNRASVSAPYTHPEPTIGDPQAVVTLTIETRTDKQGNFTLFFRSLNSTPMNVPVTVRDGVRVKTQVIEVRERESVGPVKIQFP